MSFLTEPIVNSVDFDGRKYQVYAPFDNVLEVQRLFREEHLSDLVKIQQASKTFTLDQGTKTLVAALNELNSKTIPFTYIPEGANIDDYKEPGIYLYNGWSNYEGEKPFVSSYGILFVLEWVINPYQYCINTMTGYIYRRGFIDNQWADWADSEA